MYAPLCSVYTLFIFMYVSMYNTPIVVYSNIYVYFSHFSAFAVAVIYNCVMSPTLQILQPLLEKRERVVVMGDFNTLSRHDSRYSA